MMEERKVLGSIEVELKRKVEELDDGFMKRVKKVKENDLVIFEQI